MRLALNYQIVQGIISIHTQSLTSVLYCENCFEFALFKVFLVQCIFVIFYLFPVKYFISLTFILRNLKNPVSSCISFIFPSFQRAVTMWSTCRVVANVEIVNKVWRKKKKTKFAQDLRTWKLEK